MQERCRGTRWWRRNIVGRIKAPESWFTTRKKIPTGCDTTQRHLLFIVGPPRKQRPAATVIWFAAATNRRSPRPGWIAAPHCCMLLYSLAMEQKQGRYSVVSTTTARVLRIDIAERPLSSSLLLLLLLRARPVPRFWCARAPTTKTWEGLRSNARHYSSRLDPCATTRTMANVLARHRVSHIKMKDVGVDQTNAA
jgi:hypothetical protein